MQWAQEKADAGWRPIHVDPLALDAAFCDRDTRRVDRGAISIKGVRYTHPQLFGLPARTVVELALPWRRDGEPLFRAPGRDWAYLVPDAPFQAGWVEGARDGGRRQASQAKNVRSMVKAAGSVDPLDLKAERQGGRGGLDLVRGRSRLYTGSRNAALAAGQASADRTRAEQQTEAERIELRRDRHTAWLNGEKLNVA